MKLALWIIAMMIISGVTLLADSGDWGDERETVEKNDAFEKAKIKNRSKKEYKDKVYKYITGDYKVENNDIELATVHLDDKLKNSDVKINIISKDLKVEGNSYRDSIDIKKNRYKNFVQNDERGIGFFEEDDAFNELGDNTLSENSHYSRALDKNSFELGSAIESESSRYNKVPDEDVSELETVDLRGKNDIKEVNIFMENVNIMVK